MHCFSTNFRIDFEKTVRTALSLEKGLGLSVVYFWGKIDIVISGSQPMICLQ